MTAVIDKTAFVEQGATLGKDVFIGPFCYVGKGVVLGDHVCLKSHVSVRGQVTVGARTIIYPFAALGEDPQLIGYEGERLEIGTDVKIREHVTIHPGTKKDAGVTRIGDRCFLMVGVHIGHDCKVGNDVIMANTATLGGHCKVGDRAYIGGLTAMHPFARVGHHAVIGGMTGVESDVIPFGAAKGNRAKLNGLNIVGLRRHGFSREDIHDLRSAYRILFANEGTFAERIEDVINLFKDKKPVMEIIHFIQEDTKRALCFPENYVEG